MKKIFYLLIFIFVSNICVGSICAEPFSGTNANKLFENVKKYKGDLPNSYEQELLVWYGIVDAKKAYDGNIKKGDCIKSILKIIGVTDDFAEYFASQCFPSPDSYGNIFSSCRKDKWDDRTLMYENKIGFGSYQRISGYYKIVTNDIFESPEYYADEDVKLSECLAIMNNCLELEPDLSEDVLYKAKQNNLIFDTDRFANEKSASLSYEDFCTLLYRLLTHKMGHYFKYPSSYRWYYSYYMNAGKMKDIDSYLEYLEFLKTQDVTFVVPTNEKAAAIYKTN